MNAFVLPGGGALGSIRAGMLEALPECTHAGIRDFSRTALLIDLTTQQTARFLARETLLAGRLGNVSRLLRCGPPSPAKGGDRRRNPALGLV